MAKKNQKIEPLSFVDIVLGGDAETIRKALDARLQIDQLLEEREEAYRKIAALENQVEGIVGEEGVFPFPEPPVDVATFAPAKKKPAKKVVVAPEPEPEPLDDEEPAEEDEIVEADDSSSSEEEKES